MKKEAGFTLIELMIVVGIVGLLAAIAYPSYTGALTKARRADAMGDLVGLQSAMERYYTENNSYSGAIVASVGGNIPYPANDSIAFYTFSLPVVTATTFTLAATPIGAQATDGLIALSHTDVRGWDKDNSGVISTAEETWDR